MDYSKLLKIAEGKRAEAQYELCRTTVAYCDTSIAPPKKLPKSNVQSDAIKRFLQKKQAEEYQKAVEAKKKKEELLALREMSRGKTKAKIMASRTKDNDFSKIRLTEDELEAKKRREQELIKLSLNDKVARMKARIELEEQEKLLPKKRKRKSKDPNLADDEHDEHSEFENPEDCPSSNQSKYSAKESMQKKPRPPPPPSFHELLQLAEKKQYEPVKDLPFFKDDDRRPLSKKARKLLQEEENSVRRKLAAEAAEKKLSHSIENIPSENLIKKLPKIALKKRPASENLMPNCAEKRIANRQVENKLATEHVRKDKANLNQNKRQPVANVSANRSDNFLNKRPDQHRQMKNNLNNNVSMKPSSSGEKVRIAHQGKAKDQECGVQNNKIKSFENGSQNNKPNGMQSAKARALDSNMKRKEPIIKSKKISSETINKEKMDKPKVSSQKTDKPMLNEDLLAEIEKRVRSQVQKELEAKFLQQQKLVSNDDQKSQSISQKPQVSEKSQVRTNSVPGKLPKVDPNVKKVRDQAPSLGEKRTLSSAQKPPQKFLSAGPVNDRQSAVKRLPPPPPKVKLPPPKPMREEKPRKPAFHPNPYLQPPRRLLVSQLPQKPSRRRLESDDDDDEDDDEMNEFIDDECGDSSENYSQYIKEIFGYDRSRYEDEDDDDVMETSFAEQMKEECRSAKIARKEDLEEELKEREEMRKKMFKKKQLKTKK